MKFPDITLPKEQARRSDWLADQLISDELPAVVAQLEVIHQTTKATVSLDEILANKRQEVLANGLSTLPDSSIVQLLKNPQLLYDLQQLVLCYGSEYWDHKLAKTPPGLADWAPIAASLSAAADTSHPATRSAPHQSPKTKSRRTWTYAVIGSIAAMLLVSFLWPEPGPTWGFDKPGLLTQQLPESEMLELLANAAESFENKTPTDTASLEKRLNEFDHGCQTLITAKLPQLAETTRQNVRDACQTCRDALRQHLNNLNSGQNYATVLNNATQTVGDLVRQIRTAA